MAHAGIVFVNVTPTLPLALVLATTFFGLWGLYGGFLLPQPQMRPWTEWYYYINPLAWTVYALAMSQLGDLQDTLITTATGVIMPVPEYLRMVYNFRRGPRRVLLWI